MINTGAFYDSVSACNRCAFCSRACPTNTLNNLESLSARGRNQAARFVAEGRLSLRKDAHALKPTLHTCLLCGACTRECFAKVPTHEHVLTLERATFQRKLPLLTRWYIKFFDRKKTKITTPNAEYFYIPSVETKIFLKNIFKRVLELSSLQPVLEPTGIYEYVYGSLPKVREQALKIMQLCSGKKVVSDSLEMYAFLKKYPQIFLGTEHEKKAVVFAKNLFFIADIIKPAPKTNLGECLALSKTNAFLAEDSLFSSTEDLLKKTNKNYLKTWEGQNYAIPSLGYHRIFKKESKAFLKQKTKHLVDAKIDALVLTSPMQYYLLKRWCKKYYPKMRVLFVTDLF